MSADLTRITLPLEGIIHPALHHSHPDERSATVDASQRQHAAGRDLVALAPWATGRGDALPTGADHGGLEPIRAR